MIYKGLSIVAYMYNIEQTRMLFISSNFNLEIKHVLLVNDDKNPLLDFYNFLPTKKNKDIPFYNLNNSFYRNYLLYVYEARPTGLYWKANSENLCSVSTNSDDFMTIFDCLKSNVSKLTFKDIYLESNYDPVNLIMNGNKKYNIHFVYLFIFVFTIFICSIFALIYIK
jgi:hypothetical protein